MAAKTPTRITQQWRIQPGLVRTARLEAAGLTLIASNGRVRADGPWVRDRYGVARWLVVHDTRGTVARGTVSQGRHPALNQPATVRYVALERQAMYEAELAAATLQEGK